MSAVTVSWAVRSVFLVPAQEKIIAANPIIDTAIKAFFVLFIDFSLP